MKQDDSALRSEEELLAQAAAQGEEELARVKTLIAARTKFDELVEPIITAMISAAQPDENGPMNDDAMAVAYGIQQALTGHLGKMIAVVGLGTADEEGGNTIQHNAQLSVNALVATIHMTTEALSEIKAKRESNNG